jgi:hypothetical protein
MYETEPLISGLIGVAVRLLFSSLHLVVTSSHSPQRCSRLLLVHRSVANAPFVPECAQMHRFAPRLHSPEALTLYKMTSTRGCDGPELALYILEAT